MFSTLRSIGYRLRRHYFMRRDPVAYARRIGVNVRTNCRFLSLDSGTFGSEPYLVTIGDHVTLTAGVRFVTHDGGVWIFRQEFPEIDVFGPVEVGSNVFIGLNSIILPNVIIGDNCVIGAGSVVTRSIPDNTVAAGIPARKVSDFSRYREKSLAQAEFIRSSNRDSKRRYLMRKFFGGFNVE